MFGSNKKNSGYSSQGYGQNSYNYNNGQNNQYLGSGSQDQGYTLNYPQSYGSQSVSRYGYGGLNSDDSTINNSYFGGSGQTQPSQLNRNLQNQTLQGQDYYSDSYSEYNNQKPINKPHSRYPQQGPDHYRDYNYGSSTNGSYSNQQNSNQQNSFGSRSANLDRQLALINDSSSLDSHFGQFNPKNYSTPNIPRYNFGQTQNTSSSYQKPNTYSHRPSSQHQQSIPKPNPTFSLPAPTQYTMSNNLNITGKNNPQNIASYDYPNSYYSDSGSDSLGYPTGRPANSKLGRSSQSSTSSRYPSTNSRSMTFSGHGSNNTIYTGKKTNRLMYAVAFVMLFISAGVFTFVFNSYQRAVKPDSAVAGVEETRSSNKSSVMIDMDKYTAWIKEKNDGKYSEPDQDLTGGGLSNAEKFLLGLDPKKDNFCSKEKTDVQNLVALIDPATCKPIDLNNENEVKKFSQFINIPKIKEQMLNTIDETKEEVGLENKSKDNSVLGVFEIASYSELDKITAESLKQESKSSDQKLTYLEMVDKIEKYIEKYRSYEPFDRDYKPPVHPAVYLDTSVKYNVPLRYVLAIARSESRFGTDRFDKDGNPNRIGANQNIYSIGLDDSGNNKKYSTWEDGVAGFGRWYTYFEAKKVPDCSKWRIYNPNGDYCSKIETLSKEIQRYLDE